MMKKSKAKSCESSTVIDDDRWSFLEEMDAPKWADLSLEGRIRMETCNDDSWFKTVHPCHQLSLKELVSPSPFRGKGKNKFLKVSPDAVLDTRGEPFTDKVLGKTIKERRKTKFKFSSSFNNQPSLAGPSWMKRSLPTIHIESEMGPSCSNQPSVSNLPEIINPKAQENISDKVLLRGVVSNFETRMKGEVANDSKCGESSREEPMPLPMKSRISSLSSEEALSKRQSSNESETCCPCQSSDCNSTKVDLQKPINNNWTSNSSQTQNSEDASKSSGTDGSVNVGTQTLALKPKGTIARTSGFLQMLKMSEFRRSCGGPPQRVEVKDVSLKNQTVNKSSLAFLNRNDKLSTCGDKLAPSMQTQDKRKKSSVGTSNTDEGIQHFRSKDTFRASKDITKNPGSATKLRRKQGPVASSMLRKSQEVFVPKVSMKPRVKQKPTFTIRTKVKREHSVTQRQQNTVPHAVIRQPLRQMANNVLPQEKTVLFQQRKLAGKEGTIVPGKENANLRGSQPKNVSTTTIKRGSGNANANIGLQKQEGRQTRQDNKLHSIQDIRKWERNHGRSYYSLSQLEKEKANREIVLMKSNYR